MRRYLLLLIFALSFCFTSTAEARKIALLIGIDDYVSVSSLSCCVNDMKLLKDTLMKLGFEENDIHLLVTGSTASKEMPTKANIERNISEILSEAQSSDFIFLAFAGHGMQEGTKVYFCPPDVDLNDLAGTCVSIDKVMADIAKSCAQFKWVVVDACRNSTNQDSMGISGKEFHSITELPDGIALFQSCSEGEESWVDVASGYSYFTKNLVTALSGEANSDHDMNLTLMEVLKWTTAQTKDQVKTRENKKQNPFFKGAFSDFPLNNAPVPISSHIIVPLNYPTIEEAYKNVKDGGTITIEPGQYKLSSSLIVDRNVTFRGSVEQVEAVVIDCPTSDAIVITGGSPSFQNLTVSSGAESGDGFTIKGGTPKLFRCIITSRKKTGMLVHGKSANPQVDSCIVKDCGETGLYVVENALGSFSNCEFYGNSLGEIGVFTSENPTFTKCKIHDGNMGVVVSQNGLGSFNDCEIYGHTTVEIGISTSGNPTVTGCKIHDGKAKGVYVYKSGLGKFNDCDIYGMADTSIEVNSSGDPTFTKCRIHNGKMCGATFVDNALGKFNDCEFYKHTYPEINIASSSNPTFTKCKIHDGNGGAFVTDNGLGSFIDCDIYNHLISGIGTTTSGNPTVTGCKIRNGEFKGVAIIDSGLGTFTNCDIYENNSSGIELQASANPTFTKCKIHNGNSLGITVVDKGLGSFTDCEIYENALPAIWISTSGNPTFTECYIHDETFGGVWITNKGMGTFNNNKLEKNYLNYKQVHWKISSNAGKVTGSGNTPPISAERFESNRSWGEWYNSVFSRKFRQNRRHEQKEQSQEIQQQ